MNAPHAVLPQSALNDVVNATTVGAAG